MKTEIFSTGNGTNIVKYVSGHPFTKAMLITGGIVGFFFFAGKIMQLLTKVVLAFKNLTTALKMPTTAPKLAA
jgi:hypothetical protein